MATSIFLLKVAKKIKDGNKNLHQDSLVCVFRLKDFTQIATPIGFSIFSMKLSEHLYNMISPLLISAEEDWHMPFASFRQIKLLLFIVSTNPGTSHTLTYKRAPSLSKIMTSQVKICFGAASAFRLGFG